MGDCDCAGCDYTGCDFAGCDCAGCDCGGCDCGGCFCDCGGCDGNCCYSGATSRPGDGTCCGVDLARHFICLCAPNPDPTLITTAEYQAERKRKLRNTICLAVVITLVAALNVAFLLGMR